MPGAIEWHCGVQEAVGADAANPIVLPTLNARKANRLELEQTLYAWIANCASHAVEKDSSEMWRKLPDPDVGSLKSQSFKETAMMTS